LVETTVPVLKFVAARGRECQVIEADAPLVERLGVRRIRELMEADEGAAHPEIAIRHTAR